MGPAGRTWTITPQTEKFPPLAQRRKFTFPFAPPAATDTPLFNADTQVRRTGRGLHRSRGDVRGPARAGARGAHRGADPRGPGRGRGGRWDRQSWQGAG